MSAGSLDFASLRRRYAAGLRPSELAEEVWQRCEAHADPAVWIRRATREELREHARRVEAKGPAAQPLYGLPFAIKDNLDLAGAPTTAACPEFAFTPARSATVVARLMEAGAIPIGKTNLDQFATGLVGTRSPYGVPRNPFHPECIPGGSSSGSAVAVAAGLVSFSLGSDTAGSGRVPAAFNNLVGLKPTRGWLSTRGLVPACRSLDCVSVFALTVGDAEAAAAVAGGFDPEDPYSRRAPKAPPAAPAPGAPFRFGVPAASQLEWCGDRHSPAAYAAAVARLETVGGTRVEIDYAPFRTAARLLYEGPWVAERWTALRQFHQAQVEAFHPITRRIVEAAAKLNAADAFAAFHGLEALRREAEAVWAQVDFLLLPTAPTIFTRAQIEADPIALNSQLGTYTNFANLLDCAALAVPAGFRGDGLPFGVTLCGPAWTDGWLARAGDALHRAAASTLGATGWPLAGSPPFAPAPAGGRIALAVVGAHLRGQPLNRQLTENGGEFVRAGRTAACYRLYALANTQPAKPGLVRVPAAEGAAIEVEVWTLSAEAFGEFVAAIPPPLGIGTLQLEDGAAVKGFICEPAALAGSEEITRFGGWRSYLASK
ncbi:MAG TPA: allophanate hydrolase [Opitutaceae bacterium]|jgi:allophanate hydrolase|nr:allophanate hydrolase [Opitutaceae bacterium]